jgi:hypothetical protein
MGRNSHHQLVCAFSDLVRLAKSLLVGGAEWCGNHLRREPAQRSCPAVSDRQILNELWQMTVRCSWLSLR